jgi:hypothetical protein
VIIGDNNYCSKDCAQLYEENYIDEEDIDDTSQVDDAEDEEDIEVEDDGEEHQEINLSDSYDPMADF